MGSRKISQTLPGPKDFEKGIGQNKRFQLLGTSADGLVYGNIHLVYMGGNNVSCPRGDHYDFHTDKSHEGMFFRNFANWIGGLFAGEGQKFDISFGDTVGHIGTGTEMWWNN